MASGGIGCLGMPIGPKETHAFGGASGAAITVFS